MRPCAARLAEMEDDRTEFERGLEAVPEELLDADAARRRFEEELRRLKEAYLRCFTTADGELVLKHLKLEYYECTMLSEPINAKALLVKEGKRNVVLQILAFMEEALETRRRSGGSR
jgi:hypothetical protein